ncbi:MAG: DUF2520 domain-containing protein [Thermoanaerobaculum sp.]|nr:DUF2520 domain-containing protein [Thermoanaerobaculum sp.]
MEPWLIVGAGRVGTQLARALFLRGLPLAGLVYRSAESQRRAASVVPEQLLLPPGALPQHERLLLAVRDREVSSIASALAAQVGQVGLALHTSGALGPEALTPLAEKGWEVGVFHPLVPIPHPTHPPVDFSGAVVTLAGTAEALNAGEKLALALDMLPVPCSQLHWPLYHAAATLAGPMLYALIHAAKEELQRANFPAPMVPQALGALAQRALAYALQAQGWEHLTGPLVRGDRTTMAHHAASLTPPVAAAYEALASYVSSTLSGDVPCQGQMPKQAS